jgi:hypothetical protein
MLIGLLVSHFWGLQYGLLAAFFVLLFCMGCLLYSAGETNVERLVGSTIMASVIGIAVGMMLGFFAGFLAFLSVMVFTTYNIFRSEE